MITFRVSADVEPDHRVVLTLPPEVPVGKAELLVSVNPQSQDSLAPLRTSLADWAEEHAEHWGNHLRADDVEGFTGRRL